MADLRYIVTTEKPVDQVMTDLQEAVKRNKFGVLNIHDLKQTLEKKEFPISNACFVLDVCNPKQAQKVLTEDIGMNVALPCRVSVYEEEGATRIAMIRPTRLLEGLTDSEHLREVADEVEATLVRIMDESR
jgi:uncharacterized protein (DUF302 family)